MKFGSQKLKWWHLKENKCPKCGRDFEGNQNDSLITCSKPSECDFAIRQERYKEIVMDMVAQDLEREKENQEAFERIKDLPEQSFIDDRIPYPEEEINPDDIPF